MLRSALDIDVHGIDEAGTRNAATLQILRFGGQLLIRLGSGIYLSDTP